LDNSDEIIQMAVIDLHGNSRFNANIRPSGKKRIESGATRVHGITMKDLENCRTFAEYEEEMRTTIGRSRVITYNAEFDMRLCWQSQRVSGGFLPAAGWECAMLQYAQFIGEWNDYYGNYRYQKLPGGDHSALGDCLATLELIRHMARSPKPKEWYEFWVRQGASGSTDKPIPGRATE
jgi:DNA polymerase-3 subunit epsilon